MRLAAIQCSPLFDDPRAVTSTVKRQLRDADAAGVDLVLFPEAYLLGHSYDRLTIMARADRSAAVIDELLRETDTIATTWVIGAFEHDEDRILNNAIVIERGRIVGRYAKAHPNEPGVSPGTTGPIFACAGQRFGINICNDANHPSAADAVARQSADLLLYPLNNMLPAATAARWRTKSIDNLVARARQTGCWVASADVVGSAGAAMSFGCTAIVDPEGHVIARVDEGSEGVIVAEIDGRQAPRFRA